MALFVVLEWTAFHLPCSQASASLESKPLLPRAPELPLVLLALAPRSMPDMAAAAIAADVDCIMCGLQAVESRWESQDDVRKAKKIKWWPESASRQDCKAEKSNTQARVSLCIESGLDCRNLIKVINLNVVRSSQGV